MPIIQCQDCPATFEVKPHGAGKAKWCPKCRVIKNRTRNAAWSREKYALQKSGGVIKNKQKSVKSSEVSEECKCPRCGQIHYKNLFFTGTRFYNPDGRQKPLRIMCAPCDQYAGNLDVSAGRIADPLLAKAIL